MSLSISDLEKHKKDIEIDLQRMERAYEKAGTNHILHLLLSILTAGFWIIIWFIVSLSNSGRRKKLENLIDESQSALIDIDRRLIPNAIKKQNSTIDKKIIECPWCAEDILEKAKICKHCGKDVSNLQEV